MSPIEDRRPRMNRALEAIVLVSLTICVSGCGLKQLKADVEDLGTKLEDLGNKSNDLRRDLNDMAFVPPHEHTHTHPEHTHDIEEEVRGIVSEMLK